MNKIEKRITFRSWLKRFGIPWVLLVYGIMKLLGILINGLEHELQVNLLIKEFIAWSIALFVVSYLTWKFTAKNKSYKN